MAEEWWKTRARFLREKQRRTVEQIAEELARTPEEVADVVGLPVGAQRKRTKSLPDPSKRLARAVAVDCSRCGRPMTTNYLEGRDPLCRACRRELKEERIRRVVALWNDGETVSDIAKELSVPVSSVSAYVTKGRSMGLDVVYRSRGMQGS